MCPCSLRGVPRGVAQIQELPVGQVRFGEVNLTEGDLVLKEFRKGGQRLLPFPPQHLQAREEGHFSSYPHALSNAV